MRLTASVNLPAPGRRQCVYVGLEYALAHTCVFAKQSLDAILCGRVGLGVYPLTYYRHPFFRSYGHFAEFLLRKSLEHLRLLASPTCVGLRYGQLQSWSAKLFLAVCVSHPWRGLTASSASALDYPGILSPGNVYRLTSAQPPADGLLAPASPLTIKRYCSGTGMLTCFPSVTPFGLTLGTD